MTRWTNRVGIVLPLCALFLSGCATRQYTTGLDAVLTKELGENHKNLPEARCSRGAHRGDSGFYLENSAQAIHSARHNPRYAFVEFDVQYSADGRAVVFHDQNLLRVFGRLNRVGESSYDELRELSDGRIASYEEVMALAEGKRLNIEIKSQGDEEADRRLVDLIAEDVKERKIEDHVMISSISEEAVKYTKEQYPEMATGQIFFLKASTYMHFDFLTAGLYRQLEESQADYLMLHVSNLHNIKDLLRLKPEGKTIVFWSFDNTMYVVHKDPSDRLWGRSGFKTFLDGLGYKIRRLVPGG